MKNQSLSQQTARRLYSLIAAEKKIAPGEKLPNELELAQEMGVSRATLREAIRELAAPFRAMAAAPDGLIEAIYMPEKRFVWGVQWHPERMCFAHANPRTEDGSLLLRYFLSFLKNT